MSQTDCYIHVSSDGKKFYGESTVKDWSTRATSLLNIMGYTMTSVYGLTEQHGRTDFRGTCKPKQS